VAGILQHLRQRGKDLRLVIDDEDAPARHERPILSAAVDAVAVGPSPAPAVRR
jgi:hypothetical protein